MSCNYIRPKRQGARDYTGAQFWQYGKEPMQRKFIYSGIFRNDICTEDEY